MTTIVHAAGAAELLAAIPVLTGFTPRDSVVLLPFRRSRTAGALRFDLPPGAVAAGPPPSAPAAASSSGAGPGAAPAGVDPAAAPSGADPAAAASGAAAATPPVTPTAAEFAEAAIGLTRRIPDVDGLAIAVYAGGGAVSDEPPPAAAVVEALLGEAKARGLHVVEALHVGGGSWRDYRDPLAPPHPLSEVPAPPPVPGFAGPAPDQFSGTELPDPGLFATESVGRALIALERVLGPAGPQRTPPDGSARVDPRAHETALLLDDLPSFLEELLDAPETASPFASAALIWILNRPALRDVALVQWASSIDYGDRALAAQLCHCAAGLEVPPDVAGILVGHGPAPDRDRLGVALTLMRRTIALAPRQARGGPLAAAAWLSWAIGRATHAARYLDQAQAVDPTLGFTQLLRAVVDAGMLPDWAFRAAAP
ncbi:conserved hypothetical protein [Microbacterium sp. 8M]|uniref:DUF4192 family protein n=1 Tax=Microbacterium sp. 8M TaxID=2653153 RepID=UPI0012F3F7FE|nr:DUF4192 family protein [Microbacterium sp. 8M]VXB38588.1 conserved hypothetical protein [Microbacterium sp. 8M]